MQIHDVIYVSSSELYGESKKSQINAKGSHCSAYGTDEDFIVQKVLNCWIWAKKWIFGYYM